MSVVDLSVPKSLISYVINYLKKRFTKYKYLTISQFIYDRYEQIAIIHAVNYVEHINAWVMLYKHVNTLCFEKHDVSTPI